MARPVDLVPLCPRLIVVFLGLLLSGLLASAASSAELLPVYQASLADGSLTPSLDLLGVGALQPGYTLANTTPTFTPSTGGTTIGLTRPSDPTLVGPVGAGLFATPVSFGQGSIFALQATFLAPTGPHSLGDVWAAAVGARTGNQDDLAPEKRVSATFQVRAAGARLNVVGATAPTNQLNVAQSVYDSIFDQANPQPFTLYLLVNRLSGAGTAMLTVGSYTTSVNFLMADFQPNVGPTLTAVGPSLAISNAPGRTASITVRDFAVFSPVPEPTTWAMMLFGLCAIGVSLRRSRNTARLRACASCPHRVESRHSASGRNGSKADISLVSIGNRAHPNVNRCFAQYEVHEATAYRSSNWGEPGWI